MKDFLWVLSPIVILLIALIGSAYKIGAWKGGVDKLLESLQKTIKKLERKIDELVLSLGKAVIASGSPLRLTEFGQKIASEIDARKIAEKLIDEVPKDLKSPYDVQEFCLKNLVSDDKFDETEIDTIKRVAYENGIEVQQVFRVLAIEVRDKVLTLKK